MKKEVKTILKVMQLMRENKEEEVKKWKDLKKCENLKK